MQAISTRCLINTNKKEVTGKTTKTCYFLFVEPLKRKENMFFELRIQKKQDSNPVSRIYQRFAHVKFFLPNFQFFRVFLPRASFFAPFSFQNISETFVLGVLLCYTRLEYTIFV